MTFAAVILAGGKSHRMGCDKADLIWKDKAFWQHQKSIAQKVGCAPIWVARNQKGFLQDHKDYLYYGPLAGFEAALKKIQDTNSEYLLCLPVDMPLITNQTLKNLIDAAFSKDPFYEAISYKDQVFPLILHRSVYDKLLTYLKDKRSVRGFLDILSHQEIKSQPTDDFRNINTLEDFHMLHMS